MSLLCEPKQLFRCSSSAITLKHWEPVAYYKMHWGGSIYYTVCLFAAIAVTQMTAVVLTDTAYLLYFSTQLFIQK